MLKLLDIKKDYGTEDNIVHALKGVSVAFRKSEFVSILGPSGCGKTTLLNIIGGLDRYTAGDLSINGRSTKDFKDGDWDTYRNHSIGFVFQTYNLIPHLSVLGNVELALTLSGTSKDERRTRAKYALERVGLSDQLYKRPNQLSGGQMQRVAIARALVNDPDIILADEPTGALDSTTSVQVMDLLQEIAQDRLIIMVTHNNELAERYSTRIIKLADGEKVSDTNPYIPETNPPAEAQTGGTPAAAQAAPTQTAEAQISGTPAAQAAAAQAAGAKRQKKSAMRTMTAFNLSFKNLMSKKGRTFLTAFAGSIGIIGITLILALSNGLSGYITKMQSDTLGSYPVTVAASDYDIASMMAGGGNEESDRPADFPAHKEIIAYERESADTDMPMISNHFTPQFISYVDRMDPALYNDIYTSYDLRVNFLVKGSDGKIIDANSDAVNLNDHFQSLYVTDFMNGTYDLLDGAYPDPGDKTEVALVVGKNNTLSVSLLKMLGFDAAKGDRLALADFVGRDIRVLYNDNYYRPAQVNTGDNSGPKLEKKYVKDDDAQNQLLFDGADFRLKITGILRIKEDTPLSFLSGGLAYQPALMADLNNNALTSDVAAVQKQCYTSINMGGQEFVVGYYNLVENTAVQINILDPSKYMETLMKLYMYGDFDMALRMAGAGYEDPLKPGTEFSMPSTMAFLPKTFDTKDRIKAYLQAWNDTELASVYPDMTEAERAFYEITYTDLSDMVSSMMKNLIQIISYVLIGFSSVSLVVSSIMIAIITYVSVIERTREIGVLRSIGARKKDITRVFNAETFIIGLAAGVFGVLLSALLTIPINLIIRALVPIPVGNIASVNALHALVMIAISVVLTLISGFVPSKMAAKKDPVVALRTE
ncbi:MAG: ABC transporter ATP-binding protein/permease [Clostridiales bacterium]|jgi:putative ABC transport system permease protein|nr:ABC transporter ATP-binding protein/permease [Clostridiales bacterium]